VEADKLPLSQVSILRRRRHLWGRMITMKVMGISFPKYSGFSLFSNWLKLSIIEKIRSIGGTLKRTISRRWTKPLDLTNNNKLDH
jgi:hypothetical protein